MTLSPLLQIFPRHVIEFLSTGGNMALPQNLGHLARSHADVSVLFMDICGAEEGRSCHGNGRKLAGIVMDWVWEVSMGVMGAQAAGPWPVCPQASPACPSRWRRTLS